MCCDQDCWLAGKFLLEHFGNMGKPALLKGGKAKANVDFTLALSSSAFLRCQIQRVRTI